MKQIIEDNYKSIVERGLITELTTLGDFYRKLYEEIDEMEMSGSKEEFSEELADVILVCLNMAKHLDIDIEIELKDKIQVNFERARNI